MIILNMPCPKSCSECDELKMICKPFRELPLIGLADAIPKDHRLKGCPIQYGFDVSSTYREEMIRLLSLNSSETDEWAASYIECPYTSYDKCLNHDESSVKYGSVEYENNCDRCKMLWLDKEFEF